MAACDQHVVKRGDSWVVRGEADEHDTSQHATVREAIEAARLIARREESDVVIHGPDDGVDDVVRRAGPFKGWRERAV